MADKEVPPDDPDGGEFGKGLRRDWFHDQATPVQDDVIRRGFKDKFDEQEGTKELRPYKP